MKDLLNDVIFLEPLNLFLYTWRFFATLEHEAQNKHIKLFYRVFALVAIILIPAAFYGVFAGFVIEKSKYLEYLAEDRFREADIYKTKTLKLQETIGYLTVVCNVISSLTMSLVLRLVRTQNKVTYGADQLKNRLKTNKIVTSSHVGLIFVYTVLSIFYFNLETKISKESYNRIVVAWIFFGGLADLFITCMLWLVMSDEVTPEILRHGDYSYAVLNVVKETDFQINDDYFVEEETEPPVRESAYRRNTLISDRMIAVFFKGDEGPDRDWSDTLFGYFDDDDDVDDRQADEKQ